MTNSKEDILAIAEEVTKHIQGHTMSDNERLIDSVTKILIVLCTAGVLWIASNISSLKEDQIRNEEWRKISLDQMKVVQDFMKEPRFLEKDYENLSLPLEDRSLRNSENIQIIQKDLENIRLGNRANTQTLEEIKRILEVEERDTKNN